MSYQHGYQQQPQGAYPGGPAGYSEPERRTNPTVAIIAAVLGLAAAAGLVVAAVKNLEIVPDGLGFGDWPGEFKTLVIVRFAAAAVLLIGAVIVFARKLAGAIVLVLGGLAGIAGILLFPVLLDLKIGDFLEAVFQFDGAEATFSAITLIASPLALILAILPPTLSYLKGSTATRHDGFAQQPGPGW
ncbi:MAG TPA: hypothetical protein VGX25_02685 [Actinophytocola sp.]|uniref:hypothetical protein n=1 Tax=Actinophytocola sp. TaxID=1872138 RepID=UPI002DDC954E|nr:hypothetical protein [Actinophytocola sp.]HEV2778283.1 hypothetical protein [Actinophytocola sp.]